MTLLQPQIPGGRRVIPLLIDEDTERNLRRLLEQDEVWVTRSRWERWLDHGDRDDAIPIGEMPPDDRTAARAWLSQQRHALHATVAGGGRAPDGWLESLPLHRGLS